MEDPSTPGGQSTTGHFRESDIEFLRAQAKEWLEAVLAEDLDDHTGLEDLLADGTLLYRVAQHIKDDSKFPGHSESASHPVSASPSMDRKTSMKYQPYASVEAFLNVCKEVGLRDVDLCNPSDAVDKKDIRRVCVCLRRLSKKGRTLGIQVPDFDNVKDTLVTPASKMPREAVRRTQESLRESSTRSASKSSSANGQVSNETSSSIADLRKDDTPSESLTSSEKAETYHTLHHDLDVAAAHTEPIVTDSKYTVKVAEPGVDTLPLLDHDEESRTPNKPLVSIRSGVDCTHGPSPKKIVPDSQDHKPHEDAVSHEDDVAHGDAVSQEEDVSQGEVSHEHVDRNGEEAGSKSSAASQDTREAHTATEPVAELPLKEAPVEEKPKATPSEEIQKGLFIAHLQGKAPYVKKEVKEMKEEVDKAVKKDDKGGSVPWLPLLGGAVAMAGGIAGVLFLKKRSGDDDHSIRRLSADAGHRVQGLTGSGQEKLRRLRRSGGHSDSGSDSDGEGHTTVYSGGLYKVRRGDNLTVLANKSGKKHWREIADKNPSIANPDLIYPGDRLRL